MSQNLTRVEDRRYLWVRLTNDGERRYYYRRVLTVFENGIKKQKDLRKALGANFDRAVLACKKLDAECEAYLLGETPRRTSRLAEYVGQYLERFAKLHPLSAAQIRSTLRRFVDKVQDMPMERVSRALVEQYLATRRSEVSGHTVVGHLRDLRRMFRVAVSEGYLEKDPTAGIRVQRPTKQEPRLPSREEILRLLDYLKLHKPWLHSIVLTLVYTGCRLGEALALTWAHLDFNAGTLTLPRRKVRDELLMEMAKPLKDEFGTLWVNRGMPVQGPVLMNKRGVAHTTRSVYIGFKPVVRKMGMGWLTLKIFRKVVATWTAQETHDPRVAQQMLGHKDLRTTEMYMGGGREARVLGVRAMEKRLAVVAESDSGR